MPVVTVELGDRSYPVHIGSGVIADLGTVAKSAATAARAVIITDTHVADLYLSDALKSLGASGISAESVAVPRGEASKTLRQAEAIYDRMLRFGMERGSLVIALGGGVVSDIAGFVAATYMRGLAWMPVATTLLGQVDAAIGGKTGVDHPECKNLIGAFHQPRAVLADTATLKTLDRNELVNGLAEVVKHAVIADTATGRAEGDAALFALLEKSADAILGCDQDVMTRVVTENVRIKAAVVARDETEGGLRAILNYGHTIGHAIEAAEAYKGLSHGQAVALGMSAAGQIACERGRFSAEELARQNRLLETFGLSTRLKKPIDGKKILDLLRHDKKVRDGKVRFVLPTAIGRVEVVSDVSEAEIQGALKHIGPA